MDAPVSSDAHGLIGQVVAGRYRVEKLLGEGGMGAVFRAEHIHMKKPVAVKVLHRDLTTNAEIVARFEREAVAAGRIDHPHVVGATDCGQLEDGSFYLVLEYIQGESLRDRLLRVGHLEVEAALRITRQITAALEVAHAAGIVHRDLKPENVMLVPRGLETDFVKVLDFGIAKLTNPGDQALTQVGTVFGTPEYMSPEQARGDAVDARSDVYTVGIMLYEMIMGVTPFAHDDMMVVLTRQLTEAPPALPEHHGPALVSLVEHLLRKDPAQRLGSAGELSAAIDDILGPPRSLGVDALSGPRSQAWSPNSSRASAPSLQAASAAAASAVTAQVQERARVLTARAQVVLGRRVRLGRQEVPLGVIAGAGAALLLGVLLVLVVASGGDDEVAEDTVASPAPEASEAPAASATPTEASQAAAAEKKPAAQRTAADWLALAQSRAKAGDLVAAVAATESALAAGGRPPTALARVVRKAADDPTAAEAAVRVARAMGAVGADLLWDIAETGKQPAAKKAAQKALGEAAVKQAASPALAVALELRSARSCEKSKAAVAEAVEHADARSARALKGLTHTKGCGFLSMRDCYPCLRGDANLRQAITRAEATPAPDLR